MFAPWPIYAGKSAACRSTFLIPTIYLMPRLRSLYPSFGSEQI